MDCGRSAGKTQKARARLLAVLHHHSTRAATAQPPRYADDDLRRILAAVDALAEQNGRLRDDLADHRDYIARARRALASARQALGDDAGNAKKEK
ncbi:hypothetical protein OC835_001371 [Tilletia horrida]|nr:hypothetical protein OC835_001371 [Tilletia horrida]